MRALILVLVSFSLSGCFSLKWPDWMADASEVAQPAPPPLPAAVPSPQPRKVLCPPRPVTHSCQGNPRWNKEYPETIENLDKSDPVAKFLISEAYKHRLSDEIVKFERDGKQVEMKKGEYALMRALQAVRDVYPGPYERVNESRECHSLVREGWELGFNRCVWGNTPKEEE